jgi:type II secretory pathway pseudopilin PulG
LIELLIVIVVFAIGILAVLEIFPGGLKILAGTRDISVANAAVADMMETMRGNANGLPDDILPVSDIDIVDPTRFQRDISLYDEANVTLNANGSFVDGGNTFTSFWNYMGPNVYRRIIGEGAVIPAPQTIGTYYGGVMVLRFGPTRQLSATETSSILVYGNDYEVQVGTPPAGFVANGQAYIDDPNSANGTLSVTMDDPTTAPQFRLSCSIYTTAAGNVFRRNIVGITIPGGTVVTGVNGNFLQVALSSLAPVGETYTSIDPLSVRVERIFQPMAPGAAFGAIDPYQYKILNLHAGVLLFNPLGYNYFIERTNGLREPLRGRVDYETQDWRIISDRVRLDDTQIDYKLTLSSLKVLGNQYADGIAYQGIGLQVPVADGTLVNSDVVVQDLLTGGILIYDPTNPLTGPSGSTLNDVSIDPTKSSFYVNKNTGTFRVVDYNSGVAGNQVLLALPDPTSASGYGAPFPVNANGRTVRVMYEAQGEWMVQPLLASSFYYPVPYTTVAPPGAQQYMVGPGTRIYFPNMDVGNKVSMDQANYSCFDVTTGGPVVRTMENQSFIVRNQPVDPTTGFAYIDISELFTPWAGVPGDSVDPLTGHEVRNVAFDFSKGFAVIGMRGVSISARVWHNPTSFNLNGNNSANLGALDAFNSLWRSSSSETYVQRGSTTDSPQGTN